MIKKEPCGVIKLNCPKCGKPLDYQSSRHSDGILEAMGKEPSNWVCYSCKKGYKTSELVEWFEQDKDGK